MTPAEHRAAAMQLLADINLLALADINDEAHVLAQAAIAHALLGLLEMQMAKPNAAQDKDINAVAAAADDFTPNMSDIGPVNDAYFKQPHATPTNSQPAPEHFCVNCDDIIFTNDSGATWWHGLSGMQVCYDVFKPAIATPRRPLKT